MNTPGMVKARGEEWFTILQVTDFHADVSEFENERTREMVRALVREHRPDFLAVTGDIWCGDAHPTAAPMYRRRELAFLASLETPWAFTWGNHDYMEDFAQAMEDIAATPQAVAPPGDGRGNFRIEVHGKDGAGACWDLFFLNSGARWEFPRDGVWLLEECRELSRTRPVVRPAVAFFHIPLGNYRDAMESGGACGAAYEEVLCWGDESCAGADLIRGLPNIRACFCGHSHRNDFHFEEAGIVFAYGRASGFGGYGGEDLAKGATLIRLPLDGGALSFSTVHAGPECGGAPEGSAPGTLSCQGDC